MSTFDALLDDWTTEEHFVFREKLHKMVDAELSKGHDYKAEEWLKPLLDHRPGELLRYVDRSLIPLGHPLQDMILLNGEDRDDLTEELKIVPHGPFPLNAEFFDFFWKSIQRLMASNSCYCKICGIVYDEINNEINSVPEPDGYEHWDGLEDDDGYEDVEAYVDEDAYKDEDEYEDAGWR